jgi:curved DNA-binding protein CbpA
LSYYDDLGVAQDATPEQIRESYRTLVRLLHPDQQTDPILKKSAEAQLRRVNQIVAILGDAERRRDYDTELAGKAGRAAPIVIQSLPAPKKPLIAFGNLVWIAAAVASGGLILWLSSQGEPLNLNGGLPPDGAASAQSGVVPAGRPVAVLAPRMNPAPVAAESRVSSERLSVGRPGPDRSSIEEESAAVKTDAPAPRPIPAQIVREIPPISFTPEPPKLPELAGLPEIVRSPFAGFWVFPPMREENKDKTLYLPEFIEASIVERDGVLRGKYRSRYRIRDRAVSPNANFEFEGKASGATAKMPWRGDGGSRGEVVIKMVSDHSIEVVWTATDLGQSLALKSGTAVLMRRPD